MSSTKPETVRAPNSTLRTRYFRLVFVVSVAVFVSLFVVFYQLLFSSIGDALSVQSSFFTAQVLGDVSDKFAKIDRETRALVRNRSVVRYVEAADVSGDANAINEFAEWWLKEVDNSAYAALTYLDKNARLLRVYRAETSRTSTNMGEAGDASISIVRLNDTQEYGETGQDAFVGLIRGSWKGIRDPMAFDKHTVLLADSPLLIRTVLPISKRKTRNVVGFLSVDLFFDEIIESDTQADRTLVIAKRDSDLILHDALSRTHRGEKVSEVYPGLAEVLLSAGEEDTVSCEVEFAGRSYRADAVSLQDPSWSFVALVADDKYFGGARSKGLLLVVVALCFVGIAGGSIYILSGRVETRTQYLASAIARLEEELKAAHDLQMGLMPENAPAIPGVDVAGRCRPASQVGGDFFQYYELDGKRLSVAMADVTGHGMRAAVPSMVFSGLLNNEIVYSESVEDLFSNLNRSLCSTLEKRTFICLALGELDLASHSIRLSNSGCPYPYLYRAVGGSLTEVTSGALPLGLRPNQNYSAQEFSLEPGDRLVFCSDGIVEAANEVGEIFGFARLEEILEDACKRNLGANELVNHVFSVVGSFGGAVDQQDDQTIVVVSLPIDA